MYKFIHAADIHLDSPLLGLSQYAGAPLELLRGATRRAFENLVRLAIEERAAFVVIAGDLYDGDWRDFNTGLFFARQLGRLRDAGIDVVLLYGNHDAESQLTRSLPVAALENVHVFSARAAETFVLDRWDVALHGRSFRERETTEDLVPGYPAPIPGLLNVGVLHTALEGHAEHARYAPCTIEGLASRGYDYWALGHVHAARIVGRDPWIVFPGNLQGRNIREAGAKGAMVVSVEDGAIAEVAPVALDVLRWAEVRVDATGARSRGAVEERVAEALSRAVQREADGRTLAARITVTGACAAHSEILAREERFRDDLRAVAAGLGADLAWIEKIALETEPEASAIESAAGAIAGESIDDIARLLADAPGDAQLAASLHDELRPLLERLPAEASARFDRGSLASLRDGAIERVLRDAVPLVMARLRSPAKRAPRVPE